LFLFRFSVGYISRSGGLSNELNNIISRNTDGVNEGLAIGGDRFVCIPHFKYFHLLFYWRYVLCI